MSNKREQFVEFIEIEKCVSFACLKDFEFGQDVENFVRGLERKYKSIIREYTEEHLEEDGLISPDLHVVEYVSEEVETVMSNEIDGVTEMVLDYMMEGLDDLRGGEEEEKARRHARSIIEYTQHSILDNIEEIIDEYF